MRVRAALFDLDDTLFDHTLATTRALATLWMEEPGLAGWTLEDLAREHSAILEEMHASVVAGALTVDAARRERFRRLLARTPVSANHASAGAGRWDALEDDHAAGGVARRYRAAYEAAWQPVAGAIELLSALRHSDVRVAIVTNNLVAEQRAKLSCCGLTDSIDLLVTSEETGIAKPDPRIFAHALEQLGADAREAVMVGDAWETDIVGARAAGVRAVWFNRRGEARPDAAVPELRSLLPVSEAMALLQP